MARKVLVVTQAKGTPNPAHVNATLNTSDQANDHEWRAAAGDLCIVINTGAGPHEVSIPAVADNYGRVGPSSIQNPASGAIAVFGPLEFSGWATASGVGSIGQVFKVNSDDNPQEVVFAILRGTQP